ncbi:MAG: zincin-like metallopeptidase domain-containing protein [Rhodospirillaceae bacterium]|nr:zincin-like metallopeptidase domain-containing protein [Rhodospirillaceae bacterium]
MEGLPEEFARQYWARGPANHDHRNPVFEHYVSTLDVVIRDSIFRAIEGERSSYLPDPRTIRLPPFELFFSAVDYYLTLAHELIHWADDSTTLVAPGITDPGALRVWRELMAEFGAAFVCAEMGVEGVPVASPNGYVGLWRKEAELSDTEVNDAAEAAAALTNWLIQIAPGWRASVGESGWHAPQGDQGSRITRQPADMEHVDPRTATYAATARASTLIVFAEMLEKMDHEKEPDAWERQATRFLDMAGKIDLTDPAVEAAIEAAVTPATPSDATPATGAAWLKNFQERTHRMLDMRQSPQGASKEADNHSTSRSNRNRHLPTFVSGDRPGSPGAGRTPAARAKKADSPRFRGHGCFRADWAFLVETVDATLPDEDAIVGFMRLRERLPGIDVGTVLFHCPVDPAIPSAERPWQAGRKHLDGVRWEEKTWPRNDFPAFRDHVANLMEFTVPGDERPESRNLRVAIDAASDGSCVS